MLIILILFANCQLDSTFCGNPSQHKELWNHIYNSLVKTLCGSRGIPLSTLHLFYQVLVTQCHLFYQMLVTQCHNSHKQFINGCQMFLNLTPYPKRWSKNFDQVCEVTTLLFNNPHSVNMVQKSHNLHKQPVATCFTKDSD